MSANGTMDGWIDSNLFNINRNNFPLAELQKYAGQWVAWSADGTRIVASHADVDALVQMIDAAGIPRMSVVFCEIFADEVGLA